MKSRTFQKWVFILLLIGIFLDSQSILDIPDVILDAVILLVLFFNISKNNWKIHLKGDSSSVFVRKTFIYPFLMILLYSLVIQLVTKLSTDYIVHAITLIVRMILYVLLVVSTEKVAKNKLIDYLLATSVIAYIPAVLKHFLQYGIIGGVSLLFSGNADKLGIELEVHTLTYVFGFLAIYYFYKKLYENNHQNKRNFYISLFLMLIGVKRIAILATAVALLLLIVFKIFKNKTINKTIYYSLMLIFCFVPLIYVFLIHNGTFEALMNEYGINTSSRLRFWNYFQYHYSVDPTFIGKGISYSHRIMWHEYTGIKQLGHVTNLHNDILGIYMGLGFVGSIVYWYLFFAKRALFLSKYVSLRAGTFCLVVSIYYFICFSVSNVGLSPFLNSIFFIFLFNQIRQPNYS